MRNVRVRGIYRRSRQAEGFKYPLDNYCMSKFNSLGISNEITEAEARISFSDGIMVVVEAVD